MNLTSPITRPLTSSLTQSIASLQGASNPTAIARAFTAKLAAGTSDQMIAVLTDSSGNGTDEHVYRFVNEKLLPAYTAYAGQYQLWSDTAQSYDVADNTYGAALGYRAGTTLFEDTFNRADGALGTTTSGGQTWGANAWTIASNKANIPASGNAPVSAAAVNSDAQILSAKFTITASGFYRIYGWASAGLSTFIIAQLNSGGITLSGNFGAGGVTLSAVSTTLTVGVEYTLELILDGLFVGATVNGVSCGKYITSIQKAGLTDKRVAITGPASIGIVDDFKVAQIANSRRLKVYNAAIPGMAIDYHAARLAAMLPETPSVIYICLGGNNAGTDTDVQYLARMDAFVASIRAIYAGVPIVMVTGQARFDAAYPAAAARWAQLRAVWAGRGWGFLDVEKAFLDYPGGYASLIGPDNIHTNAAGNLVWRDLDAAHFGVP